MKKMCLFVLLFMVCYSQPCYAISEIVVDSTKIIIPIPDGFVDAAQAAPEAINILKSSELPTNRLQAFYISKEDAQSRTTEFERYLSIQTLRSQESQIITAFEFAEFRKNFSNQTKDIIEKEFEETKKEINSNMSPIFIPFRE